MHAAFRHHYAHLGEVTSHYVTAGHEKSPPVVLLHGYPQTWYCWRDVMSLLVQAGYRCIAPDLRGLGDTSKAASGYDKRTVAGDVKELVVDHLDIEAFPVVGHDWGGAVAFSLAAHYDGHVSHLVVADVAIPGDGQPHIGQGGRRWHHTFLQTLDLPEALISGREETFIRWFYENYGHTPAAVGEEAVIEYLRTYGKPGSLRTGFAYYRSVPQDVLDNQNLEKLSVPALAVGGLDGWGRGHEVEKSLRKMVSNVRGVVFDECGHWIPEEQPERFAKAICAFLSSDS